MAANGLAITWTEIRRFVGREIGKNRDPTAWDSITTTDASDIIRSGLRQAYYLTDGYRWSFLQPTQSQLSLHTAYSTGTISVTNGVVTLSGGTFPSWAAQGDVWVDDGYYPVNTRDGNTQVTLVDTSLTGLSGETYSLKHREYDLPDDFDGLDGNHGFSYRNDQSNWRPLTKLNEAQIRSLDSYPEETGPPSYYCIVPAAPTSTSDMKWRAIFYPLPDAAYTLWYRYNVIPPMLDGTSYVYPHGSVPYHEMILLSCLDKALQTLYSSDEKHGAFLEARNSAILHDQRNARPQTHGFGVYSDGYHRLDAGPWHNRGDFTFDTSNL